MLPTARWSSTLFSLLDPVEYVCQKRAVARHYSLAGFLQLESHFEDAIRLLCHQLEERFMTWNGDFGKGFDIGQWIKMCLFPGISNPSTRADSLLANAGDVIGQITFSKRFGYLDQGRDFDGHLWLSEVGSDYLASVSQLPYLDRWIDKNPICPIGGATVLLGPTLRYVSDSHHGRDGDTHDDTKPDFLDKFILTKTEHSDVVDDTHIISYLAINMLAGTDTTAISIKAVLYYVLRTPVLSNDWKRRFWRRILSNSRQFHPHTTLLRFSRT
jgi:cytochrome P450